MRVEYIYRSVPQIRPPFCNLSLSAKRRVGGGGGGVAYTWDVTFSLEITPSLPVRRRSCAAIRWWGGVYARDKNTSARLCAKNVGEGLCARGGVFAGHYGTCSKYCFSCEWTHSTNSPEVKVCFDLMLK